MFRLVTVVGVLGGVSAAMAEPVRMTGDDIRRAMPGALLEIDTPLRIAIPVKVGTDGLMSAEADRRGFEGKTALQRTVRVIAQDGTLAGRP